MAGSVLLIALLITADKLAGALARRGTEAMSMQWMQFSLPTCVIRRQRGYRVASLDATTIETAPLSRPATARRQATGLDSLRFVCAMWVAFSHGARFPVENFVKPDSFFHKVMLGLGKTMFNGTAAVAVFFVISGLLIHRANIGERSVQIVPFWIRRGVRIGVPLLVIIAAGRGLGSEYSASLGKVLWSVVAEIIYYALYPIALPIIHQVGIARILLGSLCISLAMDAAYPDHMYLWSFGRWTWLFCAPLWLMGCFLAEHCHRVSEIVAPISVWIFRAAALAFCFGLTALASHLGHVAIGYTWTIWVFGAFCIPWLASEMLSAGKGSVSPILERMGLAGYAIYLTHKLTLTLIETRFAWLYPVTRWAAGLLLIGVTAWVFYRLVERPAHRLARRLGQVSGGMNREAEPKPVASPRFQ